MYVYPVFVGGQLGLFAFPCHINSATSALSLRSSRQTPNVKLPFVVAPVMEECADVLSVAGGVSCSQAVGEMGCTETGDTPLLAYWCPVT